jgi:CheY-like chemotaxis protein
LEVAEENVLSDRHILIEIAVRDDGIGMTEEEAKVIFEPFRRLQSTQSRHSEGSGLGLSICKSFAEAMGGSISVQSHEGKGSVFTVLLPFEVAESSISAAEEKAVSAHTDFSGKRALLCEDNEINRQIACMLLSSIGFEVDTAEDGKIGFQKFLASAQGTYDIVFMDIQMPEMNGYDTAIAIRASGHPQAKSIPIIAMTANVFKSDVEHAKESGMNGHIGKPLDKGAIIKTVSEVFDKEEESIS